MAAQIDNTDAIQDTLGGRLPKTDLTPSERYFTVRFWDYSRKPSNRTAPKPLKTLSGRISTREKFRFSIFGFLSPLLRDVTLLHADSRLLAAANSHSQSITLTTLGDGHTVPSENAVTRAASTKVEKLMDTLSDPFRIGILSGATRAKDLSGPTPLLHAVTCSLATAFFIDTHDEENSRLTSTESAISQNFHRYTFDILRKHKSGKKEACIA